MLIGLHSSICILIYSGYVSRLTAGKGKMQDTALSQGLAHEWGMNQGP